MDKTQRLLKAAILGALMTAWVVPPVGATNSKDWMPRSWGVIKSPTVDSALVIGSPAAGCLAGGVGLELEGEGFEVLRPERNRFYGHPKLVRFIHWLGRQADLQSLGTILVGDMSQPRGGPMAYGHGSHQNGLDVDIMFKVAHGPITATQRADPAIISVVKGDDLDPSRWTSGLSKLLEITAKSPEVERIFVNPVIKMALCRQTPIADREWLHKVRPWWGHDDHFHVRLGCPLGSQDCKSQPPPPEGDGCGYEVASWLVKPTLNIPNNKPNTRRVALPSECMKVLHEH